MGTSDKQDAIEGEIVTENHSIGVTKYPEETVRLLETAFNNDFNVSEAAQYAGIARKTYYAWLAADDIFSTRMSIAQAAPRKMAKGLVIEAIKKGDHNLALRYLMLRDPDYKPKVQKESDPQIAETRNKIKDFLDDTSDGYDVSTESTASDATSPRGEVAQAPTDIS